MTVPKQIYECCKGSAAAYLTRGLGSEQGAAGEGLWVDLEVGVCRALRGFQDGGAAASETVAALHTCQPIQVLAADLSWQATLVTSFSM